VVLKAEVGLPGFQVKVPCAHWVSGLKLEGAFWIAEDQVLEDSKPGIRQQPLSSVLLRPQLLQSHPRHAEDSPSSSVYKNDFDLYVCPVYRTPERRGTLSTTGHSTNYVMDIELPSRCEPSKWVKRGTAIVLATEE